MRVYPNVTNAQSRARCREHFEAVLTAWVQDWFVCKPSVSVAFNETLFATYTLDASDMCYALGDGHIVMQNAGPVIEQASLLAMDLGDPTEEIIASGAFSQFAQTLNETLLVAVLGGGNGADVTAQTPKINHVMSVTLQFGSFHIGFVFDYKLLETMRLLPKPNANVDTQWSDRVSATKERVITIKALFHSTQMQLNELLQLEPGDVVRLDHALDAPIRCTTSDGQLTAKAYLVKKGSYKALLLTK